MCDDWEDDPVIVQPPRAQFNTQVFTKQDRSQSDWDTNWNDYSNSQRNYEKRPPRNSNRRDDNSSGFRGGHKDGNRRFQNDEPSKLIKVPSKFVGRIIGRGGSKISDLQFESGAKINVTKDTDGDQTIIKLAGANDAVSKAEELIRDLTIERNLYSTSERNTYSASEGNRQGAVQWNTYSTSDSQTSKELSSTQEPANPGVKKSWREMLQESVSILFIPRVFLNSSSNQPWIADYYNIYKIVLNHLSLAYILL